MIDSLLNTLFRCPHRRLTRPVTPVNKHGEPHGDTYVVCLDCGKQFSYDLKQMRIGKPLATSAETGTLPPGMPGAGKSKLKLAITASAFGLVVGSLLTRRARPEDHKNKPAKP